MYSVLVLGLIPGTNIQISFWAWLVIIAILPFLARRFKAPLLKHFQAFIELGKAPTPRLPLPASSLHQGPKVTGQWIRRTI